MAKITALSVALLVVGLIVGAAVSYFVLPSNTTTSSDQGQTLTITSTQYVTSVVTQTVISTVTVRPTLSVPTNTSTTFGAFYIAVVGVFANVTFHSTSGLYNITLYVSYSGNGSYPFGPIMQLVTDTMQVISVGSWYGGGTLAHGEYTYVYVYPQIPVGEKPEVFQFINGSSYSSSVVSIAIPSAPYSAPT